MMVAAFRQNVLKGLACWLFFPYSWYFAIRQFKGSKKIFVYPYLAFSALVAVSMIAAAYQITSGQAYGGSVGKPEKSVFTVESGNLARLSKDHKDLWFQYLAGSFRWEIRKERELYYAVRREQKDGRYESTLNGFYLWDLESEKYLQTKVLVSFGKPYGFGDLQANITNIDLIPGPMQIRPVIEEPHPGSPGSGSYIIFKNSQANLEIYEQSSTLERNFTRQAFKEINQDLEAVIANADTVRKTGRLSDTKKYPEFSGDHLTEGLTVNTKSFLKIREGLQPGIYLVSGWIPVGEKSEAYLKVYNQKTNARLSEQEINDKSLRMMGWARARNFNFPYQSEITVYEGDWSKMYKARFELWLRSHETGEERMALQTVTSINGWER
jgi:hypothetical protein